MQTFTEVRGEFGSKDAPHLKEGEMEVIYKENIPCFAVFICPCGCKRKLPIPLKHPDAHPPQTEQWNFTKINGKITISPSIRVIGACKAHFNIEDGEVKIHGDSGK